MKRELPWTTVNYRNIHGPRLLQVERANLLVSALWRVRLRRHPQAACLRCPVGAVQRKTTRSSTGPLDITLYMEVSINRGSPKLMGGQLTILVKWIIWGYLGVAPFSETPIWRILAAHLIAALLGGQSKAYHGGYYHYTWDEHLSDHERFWDVNLCIHTYI